MYNISVSVQITHNLKHNVYVWKPCMDVCIKRAVYVHPKLHQCIRRQNVQS